MKRGLCVTGKVSQVERPWQVVGSLSALQNLKAEVLTDFGSVSLDLWLERKAHNRMSDRLTRACVSGRAITIRLGDAK